jgi:hypothetical protein
MTRKDYIILAEALRNSYAHSLDVHSTANPQAVLTVTTAIACALAKDNPRFNREHFFAVVQGQKPLQSRPSRNGVQS